MGRRILSIELPLVLSALLFAEFGAVLHELRTDVILDWFVSLAPLIWIDASILVLYAFLRLYRNPELAPSGHGALWKRLQSLFIPNFRILRAHTKGFGRLWAGAAVAYSLAFMVLQGMLIVDVSGTIEPIFTVLESPAGYGPGIAWAPTSTLGLVLRPYSIVTAFALSYLSGLLVALSLRILHESRKAARALPSPLLGFAIMCPACVGAPVSGLFLAYAAPIASMGGFGAASAFSLMLAASTALLIGTLSLLWIALSLLSNMVFPTVSIAS